MNRRERIIKYLKYKKAFLAYHRRKLETGKVVFEFKTTYYENFLLFFTFKPVFISQPQSQAQEKKFNQKLNEPYFKTKWVPSLIRFILFISLVWFCTNNLFNLITYGDLFFKPQTATLESFLSSVFNLTKIDYSGNLFTDSNIVKGSIYFNLFDSSIF